MMLDLDFETVAKAVGINLKRRNDGRRPGKKPSLVEKDIPRVAEIYHNIGFYPTSGDCPMSAHDGSERRHDPGD
jgi:hypothetical protein